VKVALVRCDTGKSMAVVREPEKEMAIYAPNKGWAEQNPKEWWEYVCKAIKRIKRECQVSEKQIKGVGIAYQMHGLVLIDKYGECIRKSIIWCDSRGVEIGDKSFSELGEEICKDNLLNSPGNFTASKLKWVQEFEPDTFKKIHKFMLPGDYIAYRLSNKICTTITGLSEGIFWDFKESSISQQVMDYFNIPKKYLPEIVPPFGMQGLVSSKGAEDSGLQEGTPILYRAGDQPNNALSLNVLNEGEVAATGGTSGVVFALTKNLEVDDVSRINNFAHVNYSDENPIIGKLLCINGAGIQYRWNLNNLKVSTYEEMNQLAENVAIGSDGLLVLPFGNGAERIFDNNNIGARILNLDLNRHEIGHMARATLEGIAFSFVYGLEIMKEEGCAPKLLRAGNDNLFRSEIFAKTIASLTQCAIELLDTTGAIGAARACAISIDGLEKFQSYMGNDYINTFLPAKEVDLYRNAYVHWKKELEIVINNM